MQDNFIKKLILDKGVSNCFFWFLVEEESGTGEETSFNSYWDMFKIDESSYKVSDGYKIVLQSLEYPQTKKNFFISNFKALVEEKKIVPVEENTRLERVVLLETLSPGAVLRIEGMVVCN